MLKYTPIDSRDQYEEYCETLHELVFESKTKLNKEQKDEIELLTILIEKWEEEQVDYPSMDPVEMIKSLMEDRDMKQYELAEIAGVGASYISEILNYKKEMSKTVVRNLANFFKISQDFLNQSYNLDSKESPKTTTRKISSQTYPIKSEAISAAKKNIWTSEIGEAHVKASDFRKTITLEEAQEEDDGDLELSWEDGDDVKFEYSRAI